jgi:hypothetical protein
VNDVEEKRKIERRRTDRKFFMRISSIKIACAKI